MEEEDIKQIKPLPNLDYKIVCGNSLLGVEKDLFNSHLFNELERLKPLLFNETNPNKKQQHKKQIDELIRQITHGHKDFDFEVYFSEVFHEKKGFDVVIANPPYDVINDSNYRKIYSQSIFGRANLYGLFIHKTIIKLLKPTGFMTFINPKTLLADKYFVNLRKLIIKNGNFISVAKISDRHNVFDNVLQAVIIYIYQKEGNNNIVFTKEVKVRTDIENNDVFYKVKKERIYLPERFDCGLLISDKVDIYSLFEKIIYETNAFKDQGILFTTGKVQWDLFKKSLIDKPQKGCKRLIWAENIQRYRFSSSVNRKGKEYIKTKISVEPNICTKTIITQRTTADEQERRIIATIFDPKATDCFAFSENHTNFLEKYNPDFKIEFILALINSKLFDCIFRHINSNTQVSSGELNSLPIVKVQIPDQQPFIMLVNYILAITKDGDYLQNSTKQAKVKEYERQIDQMVYELYGLTDEEIKIAEGGQ